MKNLSDREQNIVLATIRLWNVNAKGRGAVPDYELIEPAFDLPMDAMRDIRDLVQEVRPADEPPATTQTTSTSKETP
jgi:hypothetical protein